MMLIFFGGQMFLNFLCTQINERINNYLTESDPNHEWISYVPDYIDVSPFIAGVLAKERSNGKVECFGSVCRKNRLVFAMEFCKFATPNGFANVGAKLKVSAF
jgi:hypothetical protein